MTDHTADHRTDHNDSSDSVRQRALEAYDDARESVSGALGEAPLLALAGGIAAGALIAALLPRSQGETRLVRPYARRAKDSARAAYAAARDTGKDRFADLGFTRENGEGQLRAFFEGLKGTAKASADAAADAVRKG
ncbi:MAG: hypothetical protein ABIO80_03580 [Sphingomicrobium sp.]